MLIAAILIGVSACNDGGGAVSGDPVEYPHGWPLDYVTVPDGAVASRFQEVPMGDELDEIVVRDWEPENTMQRSNRKRSWLVGFRYSGSCREAADDIENKLRGKGWLASGNNSVSDGNPTKMASVWYYSQDYLHRVHLVFAPKTSYRKQMGFLEIIEYQDPVDYFPAAANGTKLP